MKKSVKYMKVSDEERKYVVGMMTKIYIQGRVQLTPWFKRSFQFDYEGMVMGNKLQNLIKKQIDEEILEIVNDPKTAKIVWAMAMAYMEAP